MKRSIKYSELGFASNFISPNIICKWKYSERIFQKMNEMVIYLIDVDYKSSKCVFDIEFDIDKIMQSSIPEAELLNSIKFPYAD